jgi:hypothetical protein
MSAVTPADAPAADGTTTGHAARHDGPAPVPWRIQAWGLVELFGLCGFVVVQPLLDLIGANPDFLIFHGLGTGEALLFVAAVAALPPLAFWGLGTLIGEIVGPRTRYALQAVSVGLLSAALAVQAGKHLTGLRGWPLVAGAVAVGAAGLCAYARWRAVGQALRLAAAGPLVFALLFVVASPAAPVILPDDARAGAAGRATGPHPPVVLIVLDELPLVALLDERARIDAERFPNFARLAAGSTWYRNATTVTGWTPFALPALLRGRLPQEFVAPHHSRYPDNLFTLLGEEYRVEADESVTQLCPPRLCPETRDGRQRGGLGTALGEAGVVLGELLLPVDPTRDPHAGFAERTVADASGEATSPRPSGAGPTAGPSAAPTPDSAGVDLDDPAFMFDRTGDNQPVRLVDFLDRLGSAGATAEPALHFLHLLLPHVPWTYLPTGTRYPDRPILPLLPEDDLGWGRLSDKRLGLQLQYTDGLLGQILDTLQRTGRYDEAVVVVTADHGIVLNPQSRARSNGRELHPDSDRGIVELAWVPMFLKAPGQTEGVIDDRNWQHIDLLPTVADLVGMEVPWRTDGISWVRQERTDPRKVYLNTLSDRRVIDGRGVFARIIRDPTAFPPLPPPPLQELVGTPVAELPVEVADHRASLANVADYLDVDPAAGEVPALVHGTLPEAVPTGAPLAIAVNGVIGAVVRAAEDDGTRRFAGLVTDETLFRPGGNQVALYQVTGGGGALLRLPLA